MRVNANEIGSETGARRYLRTPDGKVYGPVDMATLCTWATDARVIPGCVISANRETWHPVEDFPEFRLNWSVKFEDGTAYGPLNLLGIWVLASEESIPKGVALVEKNTGRKVVLNETIYPLLIEECRHVLSGCGRLVGDMISRLSGDRNETEARLAQQESVLVAVQRDLDAARVTLADRESQLGALKFKLAQTESDLAINLKLVAETQRHLTETEQSAIRLESHERELDTLRANLVTARMTLSERDSQLDAVRMKLGDTANELAVSQKLAAETQRRLAEYAALAALAGAGNQENEALCRSLATARVDLADRESQLEGLKARCAQFEADLKTERVACVGYQDQLKTLRESGEREKRLAEEAREREQRRAEEAETANAGLMAERAGLETRLEEARKESCGLEQQVAEARSELARLEAEARVKAGLESLLADTQRQRDEIARKLVSEQESRAASERSAHEALAETARLESELESLRQSLAQGREKSEKDAAEVQGLKTSLEALSKQVQDSQTLIVARDHQVLKLESNLSVAKAEAEKQVSLLQSRLDLSKQALLAEQERVRQDTAALAQLRSDLEALSHRLHDLQTEGENKTNVVRKLESTLALQQAETDKRVSMLRSRNTVLEKDLQLAHHSAHTLTLQISQLKEDLAKAQKSSRQTEQKLKDELAAIQGDLNTLMLASRCVKQVSDKARPEPIDWMGGVAPAPTEEATANDIQMRFAKLPLAEKLVVLEKELRSSAEQKEVMRRDVSTLRSRYELLSKEASGREKELSEKLAQLQKEVKTSSELLAQAMQELEKRESQLRDLRKKSAGGSPGVSPETTAVLDADVLHSETLGPAGEAFPDPGSDVTTNPDGEPAPEPAKQTILNSVEEQLQRELRHWERLKRRNVNKSGAIGKWFRWKSS